MAAIGLWGGTGGCGGAFPERGRSVDTQGHSSERRSATKVSVGHARGFLGTDLVHRSVPRGAMGAPDPPHPAPPPALPVVGVCPHLGYGGWRHTQAHPAAGAG